tara:strand:- start:1392 stop:1568 length:177 start_codon:yes stop_codon:yes gene_type:complete
LNWQSQKYFNMQYNLKENMTEEQKEILKQGLMSSEIVEDIGDRMEQEIKEVTNASLYF